MTRAEAIKIIEKEAATLPFIQRGEHLKDATQTLTHWAKRLLNQTEQDEPENFDVNDEPYWA